MSDETANDQDHLRELQRAHLSQMLSAWLPLASDPTEPQAEKAVALALKIMERAAALDGLDRKAKAQGEHDNALGGGPEALDPLELAKRIEVVSPILLARLQNGEKQPTS